MQLIEIEPHNYRQACALSVKPQQSGYLSSAPMILARAYAFRQQNSQVWMIEEEEEAIGIVMIREADQIAQRLYRSLGFVETGERDEDEILFALDWD